MNKSQNFVLQNLQAWAMSKFLLDFFGFAKKAFD
jgi:hypothetical protein